MRFILIKKENQPPLPLLTFVVTKKVNFEGTIVAKLDPIRFLSFHLLQSIALLNVIYYHWHQNRLTGYYNFLYWNNFIQTLNAQIKMQILLLFTRWSSLLSSIAFFLDFYLAAVGYMIKVLLITKFIISLTIYNSNCAVRWFKIASQDV